MLGPSMILAGAPFSTGYAAHALRRAPDRKTALAALFLSIAALTVLASLVVASLLR